MPLKNAPSACGVRDLKMRGFESPVVGRYQFTMGVVSGENFTPFYRQIKFMEVEIYGVAIYRREAEIGLLLLQNSLPSQE